MSGVTLLPVWAALRGGLFSFGLAVCWWRRGMGPPHGWAGPLPHGNGGDCAISGIYLGASAAAGAHLFCAFGMIKSQKK